MEVVGYVLNTVNAKKAITHGIQNEQNFGNDVVETQLVVSTNLVAM